MQKKLIALAIAGLATSAAFAQSNVTIYGRADFGVLTRGGDNGGVTGLPSAESKTEFGSGLQSGSRIGFKGAEDLGNGLKVIFESEFGQGIDQTTSGTNATWTNRHSYVGLTGGFGTVVGGRLDGVRYGIYNKYDPFGGGNVANFTQVTRQVDRADNAVAYISPNWSGFSLLLAYSTNIAGAEANGNTGDIRLQTIMGAYDNGPISARADYEQLLVSGAEGKIYVWTLAGSYDFGVASVSALYDVLKDDVGGATRDDRRAWLVGVKAPVGKFTLKANYGRVHDKLNDDADVRKWGIGADYSLSKRTNLYMTYGSIHNDDNAAYQISAAANCHNGFGGGCTSTYGVRGLDFGIAHNF